MNWETWISAEMPSVGQRPSLWFILSIKDFGTSSFGANVFGWVLSATEPH